MRNKLARYREILLYLVFGVATTLVDAVIYFPLIYLIPGGQQSPAIAAGAKAAAWIGSVVFAFFTNKKWVYVDNRWDKASVLRQAGAFFGARLFSLGVSLAITWGGMQALQHWVWYMSVPVLANNASSVIWVIQSAVVVVLNYITGKVLVFHKNRKEM